MIIGIIGAMEAEINLLLSKMENVKTITHLNKTFYQGNLLEKEVVLVECGIGKVNAAVVTQAVINKFGADYVINTGLAGAIDSSLKVGDIVVSTDLVYHDVDATGFGYQKGQMPGMETYFNADEKLIALAAKEKAVKKGRIATGDQFISSSSERKAIWENFKALCVEMEGAAIAHACLLSNTPFVVIRSISDEANENAKDAFALNLDLAVKTSTEIVESMLNSF